MDDASEDAYNNAWKKKKKKDKDKDKEIYKEISSHSGSSNTEKKHVMVDKRTKAQIAADKAREQRKAEAIVEKASQTHKERIMV
ncbi:hypothetical protein FSP39_001731 [Pinctada imbricata]|uniref:Uncharacterized protein n=1 Tax=Pinctada imbricata TaxID=66713 RepID=A0AA88Y4C4_PINIB|nr:hypothetical protein FSP39_001731 [Pinctada imbricata]